MIILALHMLMYLLMFHVFEVLILVYGHNYNKNLDIHNSPGACVGIKNFVQLGCLIFEKLFFLSLIYAVPKKCCCHFLGRIWGS